MLVLVEGHAPRAEELDRSHDHPREDQQPADENDRRTHVVRELRPVHIVHYHQRNAGDEQHGSAQLGLTAFYHSAPGQGVHRLANFIPIHIFFIINRLYFLCKPVKYNTLNNEPAQAVDVVVYGMQADGQVRRFEFRGYFHDTRLEPVRRKTVGVLAGFGSA